MPVGGRTRHVIVETGSGRFYIFSSLWSRRDVQMVTVEPRNGELLHVHDAQSDLFRTVKDGLDYVTVSLCERVVSSLSVDAILGYVVCESFGYLLVATKTAETARLPGGHPVYTVVGSKWVKIPLDSVCGATRRSARAAELLAEYPLDGNHFYCETYDVTRPFPSGRAVCEYDADYRWNEWLSRPFSELGLGALCPVLLQGVCKSVELPCGGTLSVVGRKLAKNPGTRYFARGLNETCVPGNEMEVELCVWRASSPALEALLWASVVFRRGTVPVWWRSEPRAVGESGVVVRRESPFEGTEVYMESLVRRFSEPVFLLNLLRIDPEKDETVLTAAYQEAVREVKRAHSYDITLLNYDWHGNKKMFGPDKNVEALWHLVATPLCRNGFSSGSAALVEEEAVCGGPAPPRQGGGEGGPSDEVRIPCFGDGARALRVVCATRQRGVCRINCADSLDRTNIACFFIAWHVVAEMGRRAGCPDLAAGGGGEAWPYLDLPFEALKDVLRRAGVLAPLAECFLAIGDTCSMLYTNTPAAHSNALRALLPAPSSAPSNTKIALQRRVQNMLYDAERQVAYELFCGRRAAVARFLAAGGGPALRLASAPRACALSALRDASGRDANASALLGAAPRPLLLTEEESRARVLVMLNGPSRVRQIVLTLESPRAEIGNPAYLSVRLGPYLDRMRIAYERLQLPSAAQGTALALPVPPSLWDAFDETCNPAGNRGGAFYSRFVEITLARREGRGDDHSACLILGGIQVLGQNVEIRDRGDCVSPHPDGPERNCGVHQLGSEIDPLKLGDIKELESIGKEDDKELESKEKQDKELESIGKEDDKELESKEKQDKELESDEKGDKELESDEKGDKELVDKEKQDKELESDEKGDKELDDKEKHDKELESKEKQDKELKSDEKDDKELDDKELQSDEKDDKELKSKEKDDKEEKNNQGILLYDKAVEALQKSGSEVTFTDVLELELLRLRNGLTSAERDRVLVRHGVTQELSILHFMYLRDEQLEDSVAASVLQARRPAACEECHGAFGELRGRPITCRYCRRNVCGACKSPVPQAIPEFLWKQTYYICKRCAATCRAQEGYLAEIARLNKALAAAQRRAGDDVFFAHPALVSARAARLGELAATTYEAAHSRESELALYPQACFAHSVPTRGGVPPEAMLLGPAFRPDLVWSAPDDCAQCALTLCLPGVCFVTRMRLVLPPGASLAAAVDLVDDLGRTVHSFDAPDPGAEHVFAEIYGVAQMRIRLARAGPAPIAVARILVRGMHRPSLGDGAGEGGLGSLTLANYCDAMLATVPPVVRIAPLSTRRRGGNLRGTLDFVLSQARVPVRGFIMRVEHTCPFATVSPAPGGGEAQQGGGSPAPPAAPQQGLVGSPGPDEGGVSQVRLIRVTLITVTAVAQARATTSYMSFGKFLVPQCKDGTLLMFPLPVERPVMASVLRVEYLCNYGSKEFTAPGRYVAF